MGIYHPVNKDGLLEIPIEYTTISPSMNWISLRKKVVDWLLPTCSTSWNAYVTDGFQINMIHICQAERAMVV